MLLDSATGPVVVDTEGVEAMMGFSVSFKGLNGGIYFGFRHASGNLTSIEKRHVYEILSKKEALVFHNAQHDVNVLGKDGFTYPYKFYDTMLMAHWVNEMEPDYSLDKLSKKYGGQPKAMPEAMSRIIDLEGWHAVPIALMDLYSGNDSYITYELFETLYPVFEEEGFTKEGPDGRSLWDIEQEFIRHVIIPMKNRGIKVDPEWCIREYMRGNAEMDRCLGELGFKPTQPTKLKEFLIDKLELPIVKHTKACSKCFPEDRKLQPEPVENHVGKPSFDKDAMAIYDEMLERKDDERAKTILTYRGWQKTTSSNYKSYMTLMDSDNVLHCSYNLHRTVTGRLSCSDPNLQQIPKASEKPWNGNLKRSFIPRRDFGLWSIDYSQLQFRMACAYAGQQDLVEIFNDPSRDIFNEMASAMGWVRDDVKTLVYLMLFGGGGKRASQAFGVSLAQGKEIVEEFYSQYPELKKISQNAQRAAQRQGYVAYWTGRRRHFPRRSAFYRAFNAVIQGGEAEIIKRAMIRIAKEVCDENCYLLLQIHDEIVPEIRTGMEDQYIPRIQKIMEEEGAKFCEFVGVKVAFKTSAKRWGEK